MIETAISALCDRSANYLILAINMFLTGMNDHIYVENSWCSLNVHRQIKFKFASKGTSYDPGCFALIISFHGLILITS